MSRRNSTKPAPTPTAPEGVADETLAKEVLDDTTDPLPDDDGIGEADADSDEAGDTDGDEVETDVTGEPDSDASDERMDEESEHGRDTDPEAEQLAAALAAVAASQQEPEVPVNDAPVEPEAPVAEAPVADTPSEAPVAEPTARVAPVSLAQAPITVRSTPVNQFEIKMQLIADRLEEYAKAMAPNAAASAEVGKAQQLNLWRVIDQVLKLEGQEFYAGYNLLLDFVAAHRTAHFSDKYLYRNFGELALSTGDRKNFNRMLHLIVSTCDRATRQLGLSQVDLPGTVAGIRDTGIQQRLTEFYQI